MTHERLSAERLVDDIATSVRALEEQTVPALRKVRLRMSKQVRDLSGRETIELGIKLLSAGGVPRWFAYEVVHHHKGAMAALTAEDLEQLGRGMSAWDEVDPFATYISGVAWREGLVADDLIHKWALSDDQWWRRAAIVSTVALNNTARGGTGDPDRTLKTCDLLKADHDDMVAKAQSWALRELSKKYPDRVRAFVDAREDVLPARVLREVRNKLRTGLKNPK